MLTAFLIFILALFLYFKSQTNNVKNYPPGPFGFPLLGHIPLLGVRAFETLDNWKSKFGPIISIKFANKKAIAISDYKMIKEALNLFADRPRFPGLKLLREGEARGIIFTNGLRWIQQRQFAIRNLKDLGFGKKSMEYIINEEVEELLDNFRMHAGKPISTQHKFNPAVVNIIWKLIYGQRFAQNDPQLAKIIELTAGPLHRNSIQEISLVIPILEKIPGISGLKAMMDQFRPIVNFIKEKISEHNKNYIEGQPRDFMDIYLDEIKKTKDTNSSFYGERGELELPYTILDLFVAGSETTVATLSWILLYLSVFPEIQEKLQKELKEVLGDSNLAKLEDRQKMPYLEAIIAESLRFSSLAPLGLSRCTATDIEFHGYKIPKNTWIFPNFWSVHYDKDIWGDPFNFRPERFLSEDGENFIKNEHILAFGSGKRICIGESWAVKELFLFTAGIFQNFTITFDPSKPKPSLDPIVGRGLIPKEHKLIFNER